MRSGVWLVPVVIKQESKVALWHFHCDQLLLLNKAITVEAS